MSLLYAALYIVVVYAMLQEEYIAETWKANVNACTRTVHNAHVCSPGQTVTNALRLLIALTVVTVVYTKRLEICSRQC